MSIIITVPSEPSFSAGTYLYPLTGCEGLAGAAGCPVSCHLHPALLLPQPRWPAQHWGPRGNPHSCPSTFPTHSSSWGHDQRLAPHYCQAQKNRREMEWEGDIIDFKEDPDAGALVWSSTRFRFTFGNGINLLLNWQNEDSLLTFSWQCSLIAIILLGKKIQPLLLSRARLPWASGLPALVRCLVAAQRAGQALSGGQHQASHMCCLFAVQKHTQQNKAASGENYSFEMWLARVRVWTLRFQLPFP